MLSFMAGDHRPLVKCRPFNDKALSAFHSIFTMLNLQLSMPLSIAASYLLISSSYSAQFIKKNLKIFLDLLERSARIYESGVLRRVSRRTPVGAGPCYIFQSYTTPGLGCFGTSLVLNDSSLVLKCPKVVWSSSTPNWLHQTSFWCVCDSKLVQKYPKYYFGTFVPNLYL